MVEDNLDVLIHRMTCPDCSPEKVLLDVIKRVILDDEDEEEEEEEDAIP